MGQARQQDAGEAADAWSAGERATDARGRPVRGRGRRAQATPRGLSAKLGQRGGNWAAARGWAGGKEELVNGLADWATRGREPGRSGLNRNLAESWVWAGLGSTVPLVFLFLFFFKPTQI